MNAGRLHVKSTETRELFFGGVPANITSKYGAPASDSE